MLKIQDSRANGLMKLATNQRTVNIIETEIENSDGNLRNYVFLMNIRSTERNDNELENFGRSRWKIENEGLGIGNIFDLIIYNFFVVFNFLSVDSNYNFKKSYKISLNTLDIL